MTCDCPKNWCQRHIFKVERDKEEREKEEREKEEREKEERELKERQKKNWHTDGIVLHDTKKI